MLPKTNPNTPMHNLIMLTKKIEVYDPALCCSTGVCGTEVDPKLVQFASDLAWLKQQGMLVDALIWHNNPPPLQRTLW